MIDESVGIKMCMHKKVRKELGTIIYNPTKIVLPNPKIHYDEIYQLMKKENKKQKKQKKEPKKIDIKKMTKEDHIQKIVDISELNEQGAEDKQIDHFPFMEEPIDREEGENSQDKIEENTEGNTEENTEENTEGGKGQSGGLLTKRIYITDISIEKDKEMFQM